MPPKSLLTLLVAVCSAGCGPSSAFTGTFRGAVASTLDGAVPASASEEEQWVITAPNRRRWNILQIERRRGEQTVCTLTATDRSEEGTYLDLPFDQPCPLRAGTATLETRTVTRAASTLSIQMTWNWSDGTRTATLQESGSLERE